MAARALAIPVKNYWVFWRQSLGSVPNKLSIEGPTDSKPYSGASNYGNWELSADRANAARRLLEVSGLPRTRVLEVRGMADRELRNAANPLDPANRRISVIVQYLDGGHHVAPKDSNVTPEAPAKAEIASKKD